MAVGAGLWGLMVTLTFTGSSLFPWTSFYHRMTSTLNPPRLASPRPVPFPWPSPLEIRGRSSGRRPLSALLPTVSAAGCELCEGLRGCETPRCCLPCPVHSKGAGRTTCSLCHDPCPGAGLLAPLPQPFRAPRPALPRRARPGLACSGRAPSPALPLFAGRGARPGRRAAWRRLARPGPA